jgi:hypothetical protein
VTDDQPAQGFDTSIPNVARVWDYQLFGKDNYAADRAAAEALNEACRRVGAPDGRVVARENRDFIGRAVSYLAGPAGVSQFIDIGAGLPTQGNVHQVAQKVNPDAKVVYVDYDLMVLAHARALLADNPNTIVIAADLRRPAELLTDPEPHRPRATRAHRLHPARRGPACRRTASADRRREPGRDRRSSA